MEHRRDGHVDFSLVKPTVPDCSEAGARRQRVQHQLPMTEIDALRLPRGSGRVERCGAGAFIQVREIAPWVGGRKQRLVFGVERKRGLNGLSWLSGIL